MATGCGTCLSGLFVVDWLQNICSDGEGKQLKSARLRKASDPPRRTPSFICEVPLRVSPAQERTLLARIEEVRQVYNACLGEAPKRVLLVRES
jgi:hypothetical protein